MEPLFLTPDEVAELLRIPMTDVIALIEEGSLAAIEIRGHWRVRPKNVREFLSRKITAQNQRVVEHGLIDPSAWTKVLSESPELARQIESGSYPPESMGAFLQEALALAKGGETGKVIPLRGKRDEPKGV
jgi:excisionase family DNA binding protein